MTWTKHLDDLAEAHAAGVRAGFASGLEQAAKGIEDFGSGAVDGTRDLKRKAVLRSMFETLAQMVRSLSPTPPAAAPEVARALSPDGAKAYADVQRKLFKPLPAPVSAATVGCESCCGNVAPGKTCWACGLGSTPPPSDAGTP